MTEEFVHYCMALLFFFFGVTPKNVNVIWLHLECTLPKYLEPPIQCAKIVSVNGPWPAGSFSDLKIFREGLKPLLGDHEFVVADSGYPDSRFISPPGRSHPKHRLYRVVRARHEVANKHLKQFRVLTARFRHSLAFHGTCFHAVANVTVLLLQDKPMFEI